ncbi:MAG: septum site-determining protein MinC [Thermaerobacter sp.]
MQAQTCVRRHPLRDGTLVEFDAAASFDELLAALARLLDEEAHAFAGPNLIIDVGSRVLGTDQLLDLEALIRRELGPRVLQIVNGEADDILREDGAGDGGAPASLRDGGFPPAAPAEPAAGRRDRPAVGRSEAVILRRTVRSGQRVTCDGSIVIIGDVNPGAEVIATGDVVVLGSLRGMAHAGARGRIDAQVIALRLEPVQIRIGPCIGRRPDQPPGRSLRPEVARVLDGTIVVEPLAGRRRRPAREPGSDRGEPIG